MKDLGHIPNMNLKKRKNSKGLEALARKTITFAKSQVILDRTEAELEEEIRREETAPPKQKLARFRHNGERLMHTKSVLMLIVILNIVDCILVLGELMLDIHYVKDLLEESEASQTVFLNGMKTKYPVILHDYTYYDIDKLYGKVLKSEVLWNQSDSSHRHKPAYIVHDDKTTTPESRRRRDAAAYTEVHGSDKDDVGTGADIEISHIDDGHDDDDDHGDGHEEHGHSFEEDLGHGFHKASITILGILVIETFLKVFCVGSRFFKHRIEVFDGFIVIGSFILDLVFIKGLSAYKIQEYVLILAFLVPWRVIRVVNSLVVAVMDHEHFRLKLLYKQKKEIAGQLKDSKIDVKNLKHCIESLEKLCKGAGIPDAKIQQHLAFQRRHKKKRTISSFASIALNSFKHKDPSSSQASSANDLDKMGSRDDIDKDTASVNNNIEDSCSDKPSNGDVVMRYEKKKDKNTIEAAFPTDNDQDDEDILETSDLIHTNV